MTETTVAPPAAGPPAPSARRSRARRRAFAAFVVLGAALVFLLVEGLGSSLNYFDTVGQAMNQKASIGTGTIRLEGLVVPGSVRTTAAGADFTISGDGHEVPVHNAGSPPQLFQANIPVVVVGHFAAAGSTTFYSNQIMVKHSASYVQAHPGRVRAPNGSVR